MQLSTFPLWHKITDLRVLNQDAILYGLSAAFAASTAATSVEGDYRAWGQMAGVIYAAAAVICLGFAWFVRHREHLGSLISIVRRVVVVFVLIGAVVGPLCAELVWRADGRPGAHAQPEVSVIERAGDRVADHASPYLRNPTTVGISPSSDEKSIDDNSYFPYLPGMVPFGAINAIDGPAEFTDARVALAGFTLIIGAMALLWSDASFARKGRVLQFLVVLPSGALPMVTGGDDLPVLALMLLALVLAERRRPVLSGLAIGVASTLKFTAWPLLIVMAFAMRDDEERPAPVRYGLAALIVIAPVMFIGIVGAPAAFVENVIRFPLGFAAVKSPAASPLLGQVLTTVFAGDRHAVTVGLLAVGAATVLWVWRRTRPSTPANAARFTAFAMCVATLLAPATRFGYLIYPANLFVWGYMLDGMRSSYSSSSTSKIRNSTDAVSLSASPDSAGEIVGLAGVATTPTSQ